MVANGKKPANAAIKQRSFEFEGDVVQYAIGEFGQIGVDFGNYFVRNFGYGNSSVFENARIRWVFAPHNASETLTTMKAAIEYTANELFDLVILRFFIVLR